MIEDKFNYTVVITEGTLKNAVSPAGAYGQECRSEQDRCSWGVLNFQCMQPKMISADS